MNDPSLPAIAVHGGAGALDDSGTSGLGPDAPRQEGVGRAAAAAWERPPARGKRARRGGARRLHPRGRPDLQRRDRGHPHRRAATSSSTPRSWTGATLAAGAVACVKDVKNPVLLARAVLERSGHLLLVGEGASGFARESGIPAWPNERLVIPQQRARFDAARGREAGPGGRRAPSAPWPATGPDTSPRPPPPAGPS